MNALRRFPSRVERAAFAEASDSRAGTEGILSLPDWLWALLYLSFFAALAVTFLCLCFVRFATRLSTDDHHERLFKQRQRALRQSL